MDFVTKAIGAGILTDEQGFNYLKDKGFLDSSYDFSQGDDLEADLELEQEQEPTYEQ